MNPKRLSFLASAIVAAGLCISVQAPAQTGGVNVKLSDDIVPAPDGYEPVTAKYVTAKATDLYISPFIWAGKVIGAHLDSGQPVDVVAKPKGYDWLLVGKGGVAIGYVPMSAVSAVK